VTPLSFIVRSRGLAYPPPDQHPDLYYYSSDVTLVWQIAVLMIATVRCYTADHARRHPRKLVYICT